MTDPNRRPNLEFLSEDQQVTLRRVAFGESPAHTLRAVDLEQLRALRLIEDGKDGLVLTSKGRYHFAALPRALGAGDASGEDLVDTLTRALRDAKG
jgi:hypothetical protein